MTRVNSVPPSTLSKVYTIWHSCPGVPSVFGIVLEVPNNTLGSNPRVGVWARVLVTRDDILTALNTLTGQQRMTALVALRSLFAFLKRRGSIFTNPTSRVHIGAVTKTVIQPLPVELVAETVSAAVRPADSLILALALIHAARPGAIRALHLDHIDQPGRRLIIGGHVRPLDALTFRALLAWLRYRRTRWPATANPHLLINTRTALSFGPVSATWLSSTFRGQRYATLDRLCVERTLEEALTYPGDPLHLAVMFGITDSTAIRYAESARQLVTEPGR